MDYLFTYLLFIYLSIYFWNMVKPFCVMAVINYIPIESGYGLLLHSVFCVFDYPLFRLGLSDHTVVLTCIDLITNDFEYFSYIH